nr:hypothetical protein HK105_003104 [Polyrhizophydium stewartii]
MHNLTLAIHDQRVNQATALLNELTPNSIKKKRPQEANKIFLYAMANRMEAVCLLFLEKGFPSNINAPIFGQPNPDPSKFMFPSYFILAIALGLDTLAKTMIKARRMKANINASWYCITPLMIACCKGQVPTVQMLLDLGASPKMTLPLSYYFLLRGLNRPARRSFERELSSSFNRSRTSVTRGEPVATNDFGMTLKQYGDRAHVRFLPEYTAERSLLPIELAAMCGHKDVVKMLLQRTDARMLAGSHFSLLVQLDVATTLYLVKCGVNPMQRDPNGSTALHLAARAGKLEQVVALVLAKIDVNTQGQNNWTPLHEAVGHCRKDVVQYLLKKGADRNAKSAQDETPVDLAKRLGFSTDELAIYFDRPMDDTLLKRKEDSISSMLKLIQVVNDSRVAGLHASQSSGSASAGSSKDARKTSKTSLQTMPSESSKRKGSDKFPSFPSFLSRGGNSSSNSGASASTSVTPEATTPTSASVDASSTSSVAGSAEVAPDTSPKAGRSKRKLFGKSK